MEWFPRAPGLTRQPESNTVIVMTNRTFQRTLGFWMIWSVCIGVFIGGFAVELAHLIGWLHP